MIILTASQATSVRGFSPLVPWAALWPIPLRDGTFMLGDETATDPNHADVATILNPLIGQTVSPSVLPPTPLHLIVAPNAVQITAVNNYGSMVSAIPTIQSVGVRAI